MKIQGIHSYEERKVSFKGKRVDKNIVSRSNLKSLDTIGCFGAETGTS